LPAIPGTESLRISASTGEGIPELLEILGTKLRELREAEPAAAAALLARELAGEEDEEEIADDEDAGPGVDASADGTGRTPGKGRRGAGHKVRFFADRVDRRLPVGLHPWPQRLLVEIGGPAPEEGTISNDEFAGASSANGESEEAGPRD
jgi:hypothetical protein